MLKRFPLLRRARFLRRVLAFGLAALVPTVGVGFTCLVGMLPLIAVAWLDNVYPSLVGDNTGVIAVVLAGILWLGAAAAVGVGTLAGFKRLARLRPRLGSVSVGADGVSIRGGFFHRRFIPWRSVESVARDGTAVVLTLEDGRAERLAVADFVALEGEIREARASYDRPPGPRLIELEPSAEPKAWLERARGLAKSGSYREGSRDPDVLVRIAEDPSAPAAQRIGSALALSSAAEPVKVRVRVAVEQTADEDVADAMAEALGGKLTKKRLQRVIGR